MMDDGRILEMTCPIPDCTRAVEPFEVEAFLEFETQKKKKKKGIIKTMTMMKIRCLCFLFVWYCSVYAHLFHRCPQQCAFVRAL